jgi:hypothetical protein
LLSKVGIMLGTAETYRFDLGTLTMCDEEYEAAVAAFIRRNGITRCPTACALPTQAAPAAADQAALQRYAARRSQSRRQPVAGRDRSFWAAKVLAGHSE